MVDPRQAARTTAVGSVALVLLGVLAVAVRLDAVADTTVVTGWEPSGVTVSVLGSEVPGGLRSGDVVVAIAGVALATEAGRLPAPAAGAVLTYEVTGAEATAPRTVAVRLADPELGPLLAPAWGNLAFVVALAGLAAALFVRRPGEPATRPLLVTGAGLLGSTVAFTAGVPALAVATGGPVFWLYAVAVLAVYAIGWGGSLAFAVRLSGDTFGRDPRRAVMVGYLAPPVALAVWSLAAIALAGGSRMHWFGLAFAGTTAMAAGALVLGGVVGLVAYRRSDDPLTRSRLGWVAGGAVVATVVALAGWLLPDLITGRQWLPAGAIGLSGLPFVIGIAVALRRHRLFDIERLANRSLVYVSVVALLLAGYAGLVALLAGGLRLSGTVAAAIAAVAAALALAPLRSFAQRGVNRLMYGDRDDPAAALARLGERMQAAMLPDRVLPVVVDTVAESLRLPYVAIDLADPDGSFRSAAEHGVPDGAQDVGYVEDLSHHGLLVGRLRVGRRGPDDPLDPADLDLIRSLAAEIGPAVQAVRLHEDLLRSRAEVVALREDERRRLRRDLHDGLGPSLAAIGLKAGLAARSVPAGSAAAGLLGQIDDEVKAGLRDIRRLADELRPPVLDEQGLLGALRARALSLSGDLAIEVPEPADPTREIGAAAETGLYRVGVEAMTNAARHSGARRCVVTLSRTDAGWRLAVSDDGGGLDPEHRPGIGLRSMQERMAEVGGTLAVSSGGAGTTVTAEVPDGPGGRSDGRSDGRLDT